MHNQQSQELIPTAQRIEALLLELHDETAGHQASPKQKKLHSIGIQISEAWIEMRDRWTRINIGATYAEPSTQTRRERSRPTIRS